MPRAVIERLEAADDLFEEALIEGLNRGCLEVSLTALGGEVHFMDMVDAEETKYSPIMDIIYRSGLAVNWMAVIGPETAPEELEYLLDGKGEGNERPGNIGQVTGYFALESYPQEPERSAHAIAITERRDMPRDIRRTLKSQKSFILMDTNNSGILKVTSQDLVDHAKLIASENGLWQIAQVRLRERGRKNSRKTR